MQIGCGYVPKAIQIQIDCGHVPKAIQLQIGCGHARTEGDPGLGEVEVGVEVCGELDGSLLWLGQVADLHVLVEAVGRRCKHTKSLL